MASNAIYTVSSNLFIADNVAEMKLSGPTESIKAPGQFINIRIDGYYLRRPISICDWKDGEITIIYKIVGRGTATMAQFSKGTQLDVLCGLGNGFSPEAAMGKNPVLIGGGVGVPPLFGLAKSIISLGMAPPKVVLGFGSSKEVFYKDEFSAIGCDVMVSTIDGSFGQQGMVTDILKNTSYGYYFTCGPKPMLDAVLALGNEKNIEGQLSFEERMGCGFGVCMGCSCKTKSGPKLVCSDGPVFVSGEVSV